MTENGSHDVTSSQPHDNITLRHQVDHSGL